ncbi:RecQ family ATP-dependent DNA helicase [Georgenia yuyongxinii]|uniref:DNA 3'-5' helicase n=1 Tax=Georgenia yuyongxinii TaxID=2589797 RepID=A0A552WQ19_9MICO|nr:RecQ family ATP-dependent DNA helicase [Georgenia yuyongxinii]TRW44881.1 RecQ family ATP-dependent DNA helicase [Georgenia yuyongxinii]
MTDLAPSTTPAAADSPLRHQAEAALRALVDRPGARLRADQWTAIEALVAHHRRALVVERTGWGKSAVYFVATALLRAGAAGGAPAGPTVIISPLLALMRDQINAAARAGIRAVTINSSNVTEWDDVHAAIAAGEVDVLLCSPERLNNPDFRDAVLPRLAASAGLVVVDEAHCISDWGHDFRPDYRRIRTLLGDLPAGIPVLATTATANARVTTDVAEQLAVGQRDDDVLVLRGSLDRPSLHLGVLRLPDQPSRVAWLAQQLGRHDGSGIVYTLTVAAAQQVAEQLRAAGHEVRAYTGQTDTAEREQLEADLKANRVKALIATSALGMGFDKPDLAFVIHLGAPSSPIAYYQQVGRAGRGVDRADVVLLPGAEDQDIWDYFGSLSFPPEPAVRDTLGALATGGPMSTARLETQVDLRRNRLETMLKVLDVDGAVRRIRGGWEATGQEWSYDGDRYARVAATREAEQQAMLDYQRLGSSDCRMAYLRAQLDDPELTAGWRCGRCDLCGGMMLDPGVDASAVQETRSRMDRPGIEVSPRRQWPTGMDALGLDLRGKISDDQRAEDGRALARLDGLGWSVPLRELLEPGAGGALAAVEAVEAAHGRDGRLPAALQRPVQQVLQEWASVLRRGDGSAGVDGVVMIGSTTRPELVAHLAHGVAQILRAPAVGKVMPAPAAPPGRHDVNSAQRLAGVHRRLQLQLSDAALAGLPGRSVVLVDDFTDSGWTLTVAARLLREAGATAVYPFVLAQR